MDLKWEYEKKRLKTLNNMIKLFGMRNILTNT